MSTRKGSKHRRCRLLDVMRAVSFEATTRELILVRTALLLEVAFGVVDRPISGGKGSPRRAATPCHPSWLLASTITDTVPFAAPYPLGTVDGHSTYSRLTRSIDAGENASLSFCRSHSLPHDSNAYTVHTTRVSESGRAHSGRDSPTSPPSATRERLGASDLRKPIFMRKARHLPWELGLAGSWISEQMAIQRINACQTAPWPAGGDTAAPLAR